MSPIRTSLIAALALGLTTAVAGGTADPASSDAGQLDLTPPAVLESTAEFLAGWTAEQRANAVLQLELPLAADAAALATAREVEASWTAGQYVDALETLRGLEATGLPVAMGVIWREPHGITMLAVDSAIGNGRGRGVKEAVDSENGVLHAVVRWTAQADFASWTMNVSYDGGVSWSETFMWFDPAGEVIDTDMIVVGGYVYIGYAPSSSPTEGRLRRCLASDGGPDETYFYHTVVDAGVDVLTEVSLASNADDFNNRIYYFAIESDSSLRYFYDDSSDGTTFGEIDTGIADAAYGLSSTWDSGFTCGSYLFLSYVDAAHTLHVGRILRYVDEYEQVLVVPDLFPGTTTSISAYEDTVICGYLHAGTFGADVRYQISYDCADTWLYGILAEVQEGETGYYWSPSFSARGGQGTAAVYQHEVGEPDVVYLTTRSGYFPGAWAKPVQVNDHDVFTGSATALEWLPPVCFGRGYGFIYLDGNSLTPYFDSAGSACPGDTDGNRSVDFTDILAVLRDWGAFETDSRSDTNCDGIVDFQDILAILGGWGPCHL